MPLQINIDDFTGNRTRQAKLAENAPVSKLIPQLVTALGYPVTDPAGRPVTYHISFNGRQLEDEETLTSANVRNGDSITIVPEMTAGGLSAALGFTRPSKRPPPPLVTLGQETRLYHPRQGAPSYDFPSSRAVSVCLARDALQRIHAHAGAHAAIEVGGILFGEVFEDGGRFWVVIEEAQPAQAVAATGVSLQLSSRSWLEIIGNLPATSHRTTLGWYHSHPGLGIFFSETDRFTHASFFRQEPWYVGLVVDPRSGDYGVFTWEDGELSRSPEVLIV